MADNSKDKDIPAPRDYSNNLAMANDSSKKMSHAQTLSYPSASAHSQMSPQTDGSFQKTDLKEQSVTTLKRSVYSRLSPNKV